VIFWSDRKSWKYRQDELDGRPGWLLLIDRDAKVSAAAAAKECDYEISW